MNTSSKLLCAALVVALCIGGSYAVFSRQPNPVTAPAAANTGTTIANASARNYQVPKDRSLDMQMFDKALLYLGDVQEADGHFDSAKTGAQPEYQNLNNDIVLTALSAIVLMGSSSGASQNPEAVGRARKAVRWLESKTQPDGTIGDVNGPGDSTMAQFFAADALRFAVSYSTRDELRQETGRMNSVALRRMNAKNGGYAFSAKSEEPDAAMLALASLVFKFAGYEGFKFDSLTAPSTIVLEKKPDAKAAFPIEDEIIGNLRAGFKRLDSKADKTGAIFAEKAGGPGDWRATVSGMQGMFMVNPSRATVTPSLEFVFGPFEKSTESYPRILQHVAWGKEGEGYDAMTLWQGTLAVIYMFTDDKYEWKTWVGNVRTMLKDHQSVDGSWPVAGEDAKRGRVWRTALHAMSLALTAPPPPPPVQAPDEPPAKTLRSD